MSIELRDRRQPRVEPSGVRYVEVLGDEVLRSYSELIFRYWEVPESSHALVAEVNRYWGSGSHTAYPVGRL